jgi:hypothetical protein
VACEECHATPVYRGTERSCVGCHAVADKHERRLGSACETCHNPNSWRAWRFDHDTQSSFPLRGAHAEVACTACHRAAVEGKITLEASCFSCHATDDPHRGAFGSGCEQCHGERSWGDVSVRR